SALLLGVIFWSIKVKKLSYKKDDNVQEEKDFVNKESIFKLFKNKSFCGLCLLIVGIASLYDVFDQQFPNYFIRFFDNASSCETLFSILTSTQILVEAIVMIFMPCIITRIIAH